MPNLLQIYLSDLQRIYSTGAETGETSFYTPLANLLNAVGDALKPKIKCVMNIRNQGAGIPDGGFFTASQLKKTEENPLANLPPESGVLEVKSAADKFKSNAANWRFGQIGAIASKATSNPAKAKPSNAITRRKN